MDQHKAAPESDQAAFFARLQEGFGKASARTGEIVRDFHIAGTTIHLRFAGDALIPAIVPGLMQSDEILAGDPQCEICLWDSESTGVPPVPPPRPREDFTRRGNIWGFDSSRYRSAYQWVEGSVNVMDRASRQAVYWVPSSHGLPAWVLASPLRTLLHWWMEMNGRQLVHAAAVGLNGRGVLIPGRGGSGKSSTSLACLAAGLDFVSDDYLALALDPVPMLHRLYSTAKLDPAGLDSYPEIQQRCRVVEEPGFDKAVLFLEDAYGARMPASLPLHYVLKPCISGKPDTSAGSVDARQIESALQGETLAHLPHVGPHTLEFLERVSREVPSAAVHLGTDRAGIAKFFREFLSREISATRSQPSVREPEPFVSVIVHLRDRNRRELNALAENIAAQDYSRTEIVVVADGPDVDEIATLPGAVQIFPSEQPVLRAVAWNRAIRESFGELLIFLDPGDCLVAGALSSLVDACRREPEAAWISGQTLEPWRGSLIRKSAFRECGLFDLLFEGRESTEWLKRAAQQGLRGAEIPATTTHQATRETQLRLLKTGLDARRKKS